MKKLSYIIIKLFKYVWRIIYRIKQCWHSIVMFPNIKVGGYHWLEHLNYIKFIDNDSQREGYLKELMGKSNCIYDNQVLSEYYELIYNEIKKFTDKEGTI